MEYNILKLEIREQVALVTISRPQAMNALNSEFFNEMNSMLDEIQENRSIRVMVLTGEGKAFVAGADIAEMSGMTSEQGYRFSKYGQDTFARLETIEIPVIAAVNGFALGGGCELTMACDIRVASAKAKFGQPEVNLGMIPGYAGTQRLSRLAGLGNALYLILSAEMITADEALRMGLVQKVTEPELLMEETMKLANTIAAKGPDAVRLCKQIIRTGFHGGFDNGCRLEAQEFGDRFSTTEAIEGLNAFLEKRKPNW
ncbi:MAG: enoyl-CoA hydratase/isomerase family protein [Bacteroidetes bacterium]|nr:enoyl-CoA hydratase/isomerase family protein [Bacteroidota bacterium]MBU1718802.1 enoyl-CoA hydratase/isomerase family protein [Bacteroidota bacterium]